MRYRTKILYWNCGPIAAQFTKDPNVPREERLATVDSADPKYREHKLFKNNPDGTPRTPEQVEEAVRAMIEADMAYQQGHILRESEWQKQKARKQVTEGTGLAALEPEDLKAILTRREVPFNVNATKEELVTLCIETSGQKATAETETAKPAPSTGTPSAPSSEGQTPKPRRVHRIPVATE